MTGLRDSAVEERLVEEGDFARTTSAKFKLSILKLIVGREALAR